MSKQALKLLFRKNIKQVPGGPADKTRGKGMLAVLDAVADEVDTKVATINGQAPDPDGDVALDLVTDFEHLQGEPGDNVKLAAALAGLVPLENNLVPARYLPSYVDDVLEFAQLSAFPVTGETGKIYVAANSGKTYRWAGSGYALLSDSGLSADQLASFPAGASAVNPLGLNAEILKRTYTLDKESVITVAPADPYYLVLTTAHYNQRLTIDAVEPGSSSQNRQLQITLPPVGLNLRGTRLVLRLKYADVTSASANGANSYTTQVGSPAATDYSTLIYEMGNSTSSSNRAAWLLVAKIAPGGGPPGTAYDDTAVKASIELLRARLFGRNRGAWAANTDYLQYDFVTYSGTQYYANAAFTSGNSFNAANWTGGSYAQSGPWVVVGLASDQNVSLGQWKDSNALGAGSKFNLFYSNGSIGFGVNCLGNTVGTRSGDTTLGDNSSDNVIGNHCLGVNFGAAATGNVLEANVSVTSAGTGATGNRFGTGSRSTTLDNGVKYCRVGAYSVSISFADNCQYCEADQGSQYVSFGANCQRVRVLNTQGTRTSPFAVPDGTTDAVFVSGALQTGDNSSGGGADLGNYYTKGQADARFQPLGASGGGGGIDYANPVLHTAAATLTSSDLNKLHVLSGADFSLSLPEAPPVGSRLRVQVASDATGFYLLAGNGATINGLPARLLWATESAELLYNGTEWVKLSGLSRAMSIRIKLAEPSFDYTTNQAVRVPCRGLIGTDPARLHDAASGVVQLRRPGKYGVVAFNAMQNAPAGTHCETFARLNGQNSANTILNTIVPTNLNLAFGSAVGTMVTTSGTDYIELVAYANQGAQALLSNPNTVSNMLVEEHLDW